MSDQRMSDQPVRRTRGETEAGRRDEAAREAHGSTDRDLLSRAQRGDELAFRRLLRRYQRLIELQAARFYLPGADGDDVIQEARIGFAKAVRNWQLRRGAGFRTFATLCVSRQLAAALARARRAKHEPLTKAARGEQAEHAWSRLEEPEDPCDRVAAGELIEALRSAAEGLSELERNALAHALAGWSSGETATRLGIARKSADNALQRARGKVTAQLATRAA